MNRMPRQGLSRESSPGRGPGGPVRGLLLLLSVSLTQLPFQTNFCELGQPGPREQEQKPSAGGQGPGRQPPLQSGPQAIPFANQA